MLSIEKDPPYTRPSLSKGLWKGRPMEKIWRNTEKLGVDLLLGREVSDLDLASRRVRDESGAEYAYGKLLLATGGTPLADLRAAGAHHAVPDMSDLAGILALLELG